MIKSFNKFLSTGMLIVLCIVMLAGCANPFNRTPTARELIIGSFGSDEIQSIKATIEADIDANIDLSSVGMSGKMAMTYQMEFELGGDMQGNAFTNGYIDYNMFGMTGTQKIESYEIVDENNTKIYSYDENTGRWTMNHDTVKNGETFINSIVDMVNIENFTEDSLTVETTEEFYVVKGVINSKDLKDSIEVLNRLVGSENLVANNLSFNIKMNFNKDTKELKTLILELDTETAPEIIKTAYNSLNLKVEISEINTVKIEVPQKVLDSIEDDLLKDEITEPVFESETN